MQYDAAATELKNLLGLESNPVAITFLTEPPPDLSRIETSGPAGCAYWKLASDGQVFYTTGDDHLNCTIGAYTHGVPLPADKAAELESTIGMMVTLKYLRAEEVPLIPRRTEPVGVIVYAPLAMAPRAPDVVLVRGNAKQIMLAVEAAHAVGIGHEGTMMGRPACAVIAATMQSGRASTSLGCIGNRVYTSLADDEFYIALPGGRLADVVAGLADIIAANKTLAEYHQARCACG